MLKRITALFLVMLLCSFPITAPAEEKVAQNNTLSDKAAKILTDFGVIENTVNLSEPVLRDVFLCMTMIICGTENVDTEGNSYTDVTNDNPYKNAIETATKIGLVQGIGDGLFGPSSEITKETAAKILVKILGYEPYAEAYGGYPGGYLSVASMLGILKGVVIGDGSGCLMSDACIMIYNAMNTDVLQKKGYPDTTFFSEEGKNPMNLYMGIETFCGTITANDITSLDGGNGVRSGFVKIENELFDENESDAGKFIGLPVKAYFKVTENDNKTLLSVEMQNYVKKTFITAENISDKTSSSKLYFLTDKTNLKSHKISSSPTIVYNGKVFSGTLSQKILKPENGSVTLYDINGNKTADVLVIENSLTYVVNDITSCKITDKYGKPDLLLNTEDDSQHIYIERDGEEIPFSDIAENDVLSVCISLDGKYIKIIDCNNKFRATLTEKGTDYIIADGRQYEIAKGNEKAFENLSIGETKRFYLTYDEKAAGFGSPSGSRNLYAYIIAGALEKKGVDNERTASLRVFTSEDELKTLKTADTILLDNSSYSTKDEKYNGKRFLEDLEEYNSYAGRNVIKNQLVQIELNNDEQITSVTRPINNTAKDGGNGAHTDGFSLDYTFHSESAHTSYKGFGIVAGQYGVKGSRGIKAPSPEMWNLYYKTLYGLSGNSENSVSLNDIEKSFSVFTPSEEWYNDYLIYHIDLYNVNEARCPEILVEQKSGGTSSSVVPLEFFAVEKIVTALDDDGAIVNKIYGCYKGVYSGYIIDTEAEAFKNNPSLAVVYPGDVICVSLDSLDRIKNIIKMFTMNPYNDTEYDPDADVGAKRTYLLNSKSYDVWTLSRSNTQTNIADYERCRNSSWDATGRVIHGKIQNYDGSLFTISLGENKDGIKIPERMLGTDQTKIYVYDETNHTVRIGSKNDIEPRNERQTAVIRNKWMGNMETILINRDKNPSEPIYWIGAYTD